MLLARVVGHVVSTAKHDRLTGARLLLVQPETPAGRPAGPEMTVADPMGAGPGERVLVVVEGRSAGEATERPQGPLDAAIVGIVDTVELL